MCLAHDRASECGDRSVATCDARSLARIVYASWEVNSFGESII